MRVMSQRRCHSVNFDHVIFWMQSTMIHAETENGRNIMFGKYKTQERAAEVFSDLHKAYVNESGSSVNSMYCLPEE